MRMFRSGNTKIDLNDDNSVSISKNKKTKPDWKIAKTNKFRTQREAMEYYNQLVKQLEDAPVGDEE